MLTLITTAKAELTAVCGLSAMLVSIAALFSEPAPGWFGLLILAGVTLKHLFRKAETSGSQPAVIGLALAAAVTIFAAAMFISALYSMA